MSSLSLSTGRISGWILFAFVASIAVHSFVPTVRFPWALLVVPFVGFLVLALLSSSRIHTVLFLVLAAMLFGWWRFDVAPEPRLRRVDGRQFAVRVPDETSFFAKMRQAATKRIQGTMPRDEAELVTGILYGDQELSALQKERFRNAGLMHIVAVSGSNVTIVVQCMFLGALALRLRRRQAFIVTTIAIILFVGFVGGAPPVTRAAFMGWLLLVAREVGRRASPYRLLLVAATVLLLVNPWQLGFDIGFALSFLAMWGLMMWTPIFERVLHVLPTRFEIRQSASMTLAATLTTAPYGAWVFGQVSLAGLFTNILALPLIPFIMGFGMISALWGGLPYAAIVNAPVVGLVQIVMWIAALTELFPSLSIQTDAISFSAMISVYLLQLYFARWLQRKNDLSTEKRCF